jgi:hypothetical protein
MKDATVMKLLRPKTLCAVVTVALVYAFFPPARADRLPTPEERSRIEQTLRDLGFHRWGEIELEHGLWEIDDAQHADGKKYELKLNLDTIHVVKQKEDH